ncbi:related to OrfH, unknown gene in trichothecene gene cluster [Rhynchosporium graminicola]|uniref:Linalool dehydratase/isomerase domain-containing protein n=1 Tax=Rhynchosporium graminicola TaxID=2792576 RepID=A0A1E1KWA7_9HELO|nr:related to OrfH, unknown gene in trichothecene gene cluster [Rhynchosporium commune]
MFFQSSLTAAIGLATLATALTCNSSTKLSTEAQDLFEFSMSINDARFDESYKMIWTEDNGPWSVRFTAWYTAGLLYRNQGDDLENAKGAINLATQMNENFTSPWYGDFKLSPDEPSPQTPLYPPKIYGSYDPNWREFVGSQLVQCVEEFEDLLGPDLVQEIETAMVHAAVGAMKRNGTNSDGDNLILAYSNPAYMRALNVGWIGSRIKNQTFIDFGNTQGDELFKLFTKMGANTMGEYNAPNYYGMDFWALGAMEKYGPENSSFKAHAPVIMAKLWDDIADHYNPYLGNMVGPYDRAYTRDMNVHDAILSLYFWGIFGHGKAAGPPKGEIDLRYDAAQGSAIALILDNVASAMSLEVKEALLGEFGEKRLLNRTVYYDLETDNNRTTTAWISKSLMIGGQKLAENVDRGKQFVPAIVHWASDPTHKPRPLNGYFSLFPSTTTITAIAESQKLTISYPNTTQDGSDSFQFMLSGIPPPWSLAGNVVDGFTNVPCLDVNVTAPGLQRLPTVYGSSIYGSWYYNITYLVPSNFTGTPMISFDLAPTC